MITAKVPGAKVRPTRPLEYILYWSFWALEFMETSVTTYSRVPG